MVDICGLGVTLGGVFYVCVLCRLVWVCVFGVCRFSLHVGFGVGGVLEFVWVFGGDVSWIVCCG